ncbi:MAG: NUDIX domain-containing protein [Clostridia bacterium]|nr:NUDIX domain-containing protein [Clostridia bacterium]
MKEQFAKPCVGAIIEKSIGGIPHILLQTRQKPDGDETNGKLEIPAGKFREYEGIFDALRREVREETGLMVTKINGEEAVVPVHSCGAETIAVEPFCVAQNQSGAYSILLLTFVCQAEGELLDRTEETEGIRWVPVSVVERMVREEPERFFFMHLQGLRKYLGI